MPASAALFTMRCELLMNRSEAYAGNEVMFRSMCTHNVLAFRAISTRQAGPLPLPQYTMRCGFAMAECCSTAKDCKSLRARSRLARGLPIVAFVRSK